MKSDLNYLIGVMTVCYSYPRLHRSRHKVPWVDLKCTLCTFDRLISQFVQCLPFEVKTVYVAQPVHTASLRLEKTFKGA